MEDLSEGDYDLQDLCQFVKGQLQTLLGMTSMDSNRMTCVYFLTASAKLLAIDLDYGSIKKWVLAQQIGNGMFKGGPCDGAFNIPHLPSTYTALCLLIMCGDYSFSTVDRELVLKELSNFQ